MVHPKAPLPPVEPWNVLRYINDSKANSSTVKKDIPMKLIKEYGPFLAEPISDIWKKGLSHGEYPNIWKIEIVTPVSKVNPPKKLKDLRKIAGTKNISNVFGKYIC